MYQPGKELFYTSYEVHQIYRPPTPNTLYYTVAAVYGSTRKVANRSCGMVVVVVVVSHIQLIGCQPEKNYSTVANPARGLLNRGKKEKRKSGSAPPPPAPPRARCSFGENENNKNNESRRASTCLGATQVGVTQVVSVRLASVQGFLRLVG